ncbi:MAG: LysR family transcriptional regulator [Alphaproteobacteria bacterium]|nr:LysR family transcriptional regulator [Alphaproteobacteria bacterium]MDE2042622.1 LysR family transcriptional regulator [Alphaproteobacteria bacterium]MDE2340845.1 LysR family transcriptional regulator [Alphaproteobacteria bacterium]
MMRIPAEFDLHAIEVFLLTVELGGMTQSAQHMQITQSAVSQIIARLEACVGAPLFDRSLRPLGLTIAGKMLYERGQSLLADTKRLYDDVRSGEDLPLNVVTIGMSESLAVPLTAPLIAHTNAQVRQWKIRSGISAKQHDDFLARRFDILVTGSNMLEQMPGIDHHSVVDDPFVLVFPRDWSGSIEPDEVSKTLPFIRYALDTGMGQRIERQLVRLRLHLPQRIEVDITHQQLMTVARGLGWSITSLLCLAAQSHMLPDLRIEPMVHGTFKRRVQVLARAGEFGRLPEEIAVLGRCVLRDTTFPPLIDELPWLESQIGWPSTL